MPGRWPPALVWSPRRGELHRIGWVVLHGVYFGNLGGAGGVVKRAFAVAFGSFEAREAEFRRTAAALGGGSRWALLALNGHTGELHNYWMWDHMHAPAIGIPLLALDMYEHRLSSDGPFSPPIRSFTI